MIKKSISFTVSPRNNGDINGIIHQIPSVHVNAYAISVHSAYTNETRGPQHVLNHSSPISWCSDNIQNQWIVINFTKMRFF